MAPLDTASIQVQAWDDVVEGLPDDGGSLSGPRILAQDFQGRFRRSIERRIAKAGMRLDTASPVDTAPAANAAAALPIDTSALVKDSAAAPDSASAAADTVLPPPVAAPAPRPPAPSADYRLAVLGLDVHRGKGDVLVPKVGTLTLAPLYFNGTWILRDSASRTVSQGRFQCVITTNRRASEAEWRKAYDEAARQVIAETPFRR